MASAQTVADMLRGSQTVAAPPGFVPEGSPPPPPAPEGFVPEDEVPHRNILSPLAGTIKDAATDLAKDQASNYSALGHTGFIDSLTHPFGPGGVLSGAKTVADLFNLATSLITGAVNTVTEPASKAIVGALGPVTTAPKLSLAGGVHLTQPQRQSVEQSQQTVQGALDTAAMAGMSAEGRPMAGYGAPSGPHGEPVTAKAIAETTPKELMIDPHGELTPDGLEASIKHDIPPEQIKSAYEGAPEGPTTAQELVSRETAPVEPAPAETPLAEPVASPEGVSVAIPPTDTAPAQPKTATARLTEAQGLPSPVPLTPGQAAQDVVIQRSENDLKNTSQIAGYKAEDFRKSQQTAIQSNLDAIRSTFGDPNLTTQARGETVQAAVRQLEQQGAAGVTAKYTAAKELNGPAAPIEKGGILDAADDVIINKPVEPGTRNALEALLAKYGMLEGDVTPAGRYSIVTPKEGSPVRIIGEVAPLTLDNAEQFRQGLNAIYRAEQHGFVGAVTRALDAAVDGAIEKGAASEKTDAFKAARTARREHAKVFEAKDIVSRMAGFKSGTTTDLVSPERVIREALGSGPDDLTNLKRLKAVLLNKATPESIAAWKAVQSQGVEDILAKSLDPHGGVSGAKLTRAINQFGRVKLKTLLGDTAFNQFMKTERVIRNATVALPNTVNSSGSAYAAARIGGEAIKKLAKIITLGPVGEILTRMTVKPAQEVMAARTIAKTTNFTLQDAAKLDAKAAQRSALKLRKAP